MNTQNFFKTRIQDFGMSFMNPLRAEAIKEAKGDVLEVGFGTGLNLCHYPPCVTSVTGLDPLVADSMKKVAQRIIEAPFPVERCHLDADGELPFDDSRFDTIVTTWTLCSIPEAHTALAQMRRVLKPGGRYVFIEHGLSSSASTARWQERINPLWNCITNGCNINRKIDHLIENAGFQLTTLDRFRAKGPAITAAMYRGVAIRA